MASSPVVGTFATSKDGRVKSPAPSLMQRIPSSRGCQNSAQSLLPEARNRPSSSTSNRASAGNGVHEVKADEGKVAGVTDRSTNDVKTPLKELPNADDGNPIEEDTSGGNDMREPLPVGNQGIDQAARKEDLEPTTSQSRQDRPRSMSISTRGNGKTSKTATPTQGLFTESQRTRPVRGAEPGKRSHKKGAGLAAQLAASVQDNDEEEEGGEEPRYCYCNQISYGEMVACDMGDCPREWFHLDCLGLNKAPKGTGKSHPQ